MAEENKATAAISKEFHGFSLQITVTVKPEDVNKFLELTKPVMDIVSKEEDCTFFEMWRSDDEPGVVRWIEGWRKDREWFMSVILPSHKELLGPYMAATEALFIKPRVVQIFEKLPLGWAKAKIEHFGEENLEVAN